MPIHWVRYRTRGRVPHVHLPSTMISSQTNAFFSEHVRSKMHKAHLKWKNMQRDRKAPTTSSAEVNARLKAKRAFLRDQMKKDKRVLLALFEKLPNTWYVDDVELVFVPTGGDTAEIQRDDGYRPVKFSVPRIILDGKRIILYKSKIYEISDEMHEVLLRRMKDGYRLVLHSAW